jgi:cell wall-associated NlpC family hydrolase
MYTLLSRLLMLLILFFGTLFDIIYYYNMFIMNRLSFLLAFSGFIVLFSSCSTSNKFGNLSDKYSSGRTHSESDRTFKTKESGKSEDVAEAKSNKKSKDNSETKKDKKSKDPIIVKTNGSSDKSPKVKNDTYKPNAGNATAEMMKRADIVQSSFKFIGIPYKSSGNTPEEGFDCSGFTNYVFNINGYKVSGPSTKLANMGVFRTQSQLKPGDLVFFGLDGTVNHVGMVTNSNKDQTYFIHSSSSMGIKVDEINASEYWKKRFMFGRDILFELMTSKDTGSRAQVD